MTYVKPSTRYNYGSRTYTKTQATLRAEQAWSQYREDWRKMNIIYEGGQTQTGIYNEKQVLNAFQELAKLHPMRWQTHSGRKLKVVVKAKWTGNATYMRDKSRIVIAEDQKDSLCHEFGHFLHLEVLPEGSFAKTAEQMRGLAPHSNLVARTSKQKRKEYGQGSNWAYYWDKETEIFARAYEVWCAHKLPKDSFMKRQLDETRYWEPDKYWRHKFDKRTVNWDELGEHDEPNYEQLITAEEKIVLTLMDNYLRSHMNIIAKALSAFLGV